MEKCEYCCGHGYVFHLTNSNKCPLLKECTHCSGTGLQKLDLNLVEYKQPFPKAKD